MNKLIKEAADAIIDCYHLNDDGWLPGDEYALNKVLTDFRKDCRKEAFAEAREKALASLPGAYASGTFYGYIIFRVLIGFNSYMWVLFFIGFGKKTLNRTNKILVYLSEASFPFYILHLFSVTVFSFIFLKLFLNPYFEFFLVSILSFITTLLIYEILLGHYGLRLFFGLKKKKQ